MVWIFISLAVAGFFFPPTWLVLVGYAIYVYASRESRRNRAIETRVQRMVLAGQDFAVFNELYFEAAPSYAIAKGSTVSDHEGASARMIVGHRTYSVAFVRDPRGGTAISIRDASGIDRELDEDALRTAS